MAEVVVTTPNIGGVIRLFEFSIKYILLSIWQLYGRIPSGRRVYEKKFIYIMLLFFSRNYN